jgi:hypothetical protein
MSGSMRQGELAADLQRRTAASTQRARALVEGLDDATLRRGPAAGGWSAAQVFEHLVVSAESYLAVLPALLAKARARHPGGPQSEWRPSRIGGWLARSLAPGTRPMPAPRVYRPAAQAAPDYVARFLDTQERFAAAIGDAGDVEWRRVRLGSPVMKLIRMNLGDALVINTVHVERHLGQVERVLAEVAGGARAPAAK